MKTAKIQLNRLFEAARGAPAEAPETMPDYLKTRIVAHCRAATGAGAELIPSIGLIFRLGLAMACVIMLGCMAWSYSDLTYQPNSDLEYATLSVNLELQQ